MPRTEEENLRIREEQRKHILVAAVKVLARQGLKATKMADIAAEADVSYGLVYHYFSNKEQILSELLKGAFEKGCWNAQQALEIPGTPLERLSWFVTTSLQMLRERPEFLAVVYQMYLDGAIEEKWRERAVSMRQMLTGTLRSLIVEGQSTGEIVQDDPDQLLMVLISCIQGLAFKATFHGADHFPDPDIILRIFKP